MSVYYFIRERNTKIMNNWNKYSHAHQNATTATRRRTQLHKSKRHENLRAFVCDCFIYIYTHLYMMKPHCNQPANPTFLITCANYLMFACHPKYFGPNDSVYIYIHILRVYYYNNTTRRHCRLCDISLLHAQYD